MIDRLCKGPQPRVGGTLGVVVPEVVQIPKFRHHRDRVPLVALILERLARGHGDDVRFTVLVTVSVVASRGGPVCQIEGICISRASSVLRGVPSVHPVAWSGIFPTIPLGA